MGYYDVTEYDAVGKPTAHTSYNKDGGRFVDVYVDGKVVSGIGYDKNGEKWATAKAVAHFTLRIKQSYIAIEVLPAIDNNAYDHDSK